MRKNLLYLFAMICAMSLFTACSDDDDNSSSGSTSTDSSSETSSSWSSLSGTYSDKLLTLTMNETTIPVDGKSVEINASSATSATITLNNVVPESSSVAISATMSSSGDVYAFTGSTTAGECTVSINGTVEDGVANIVYERAVTSAVVGSWTLKSESDAIYTNIDLGNDQINTYAAMLAPTISSLIWAKVSSVDITLSENGLFGVSWTKVGETEATDLSSVFSYFSIQYCVIDGQYYLAVDKNYISLLTTLLSMDSISTQLEALGLTSDSVIEMINSLLVDLGGYYGFGLNMTLGDSEVTFYADKEMVVEIVTLLSNTSLLDSLIPSDYQTLVSMALTLLPNAESLDFGLTFTK